MRTRIATRRPWALECCPQPALPDPPAASLAVARVAGSIHVRAHQPRQAIDQESSSLFRASSSSGSGADGPAHSGAYGEAAEGARPLGFRAGHLAALHPARQADRERARGELQRQAARRVLEPELVLSISRMWRRSSSGGRTTTRSGRTARWAIRPPPRKERSA